MLLNSTLYAIAAAVDNSCLQRIHHYGHINGKQHESTALTGGRREVLRERRRGRRRLRLTAVPAGSLQSATQRAAAARRSNSTVGPAAGAAGYKQGAAAEAAGALSRIFLRTILRARGLRALLLVLRGRLAANGVRAGRGVMC